jgi:LuxR family maltose regulon positive regulatory protein
VLLLVRVFLAQQQYAQALETLEHWSQYFDRPADIQTAIEWMALYVVALHHSGQREQAVHVAARLFAMTEPEGYARLDLDTGEPLMKQVLLMLLEAPPEDDPNAVTVALSRSSVARWLSAFEQEEQKRARRASTPLARKPEIQPEPTPAEVQMQRAEPLSPQELKVLRLLVAGRTYAEMAQTLIVSIHTIKTQVSSIYRKLGVSWRAEAIAATHHFRLL